MKRTASVAYLRLQGSSVLVWWLVMFASSDARSAFLPYAAPPVFLFGFLPGDILLVAAGSLVAADQWKESAPPVLAWMAAGALWYATAFVTFLSRLVPRS